jgi:hypothetical protein
MSAAVAERPTNVFRIKQSIHEDVKPGWVRPVGPDDKPLLRDENGQPIMPEKHTYRAGQQGNDVIRTHHDLVKKFGGDKFERLSGDPSLMPAEVSAANDKLLNENEALRQRIADMEAAAKAKNPVDPTALPPQNVELAGLTEEQLVQHAQAEEIDVAGIVGKVGLVDAIVAGRAAKSAPKAAPRRK